MLRKKLSLRRRVRSGVLYALMALCALLTAALVVFLVVFVMIKGLPNITWQLLSTKPSTLNGTIGILPDILSTLYVVLASIVIVLPLGVGAAYSMTETSFLFEAYSVRYIAAPTPSGSTMTMDASTT